MQHSRVVVVVALAAGLALVAPTKMTAAPPASLPTVAVSGVTATSPVLRSAQKIDVNATVTATFDTASTTSSTDFTRCTNGNNFCNTGDNTVGSKKVVTTTQVTVSNQTTTVSATSPAGNIGPSDLVGTAWTGVIATPDSGTDGNNTVTVTAVVSETVTNCTPTATSYWTGNNGSGTQVGTTDTSGPNCDGGVLKTGSGSANGEYVLDINAPTLTLQPDDSQPTVLQGEVKNIHNVLIDGSAGTAYTLTDTAIGPGGYHTVPANGGGTFGPGGPDGIASKEHDLVGIHIACDAPTGTYTASAVANTVDLGGNSFPPIDSVAYAGPPVGGATDTFEVLPGLALESQTVVVAELSGDYAPMSCFTAQQSGRKVSTFPGSVHIAAVVNTTGACAGFGTISGTTTTLTLPDGFSFDKTGNSPAAHVFVFPAAEGFDYHYPDPASEVTNLIPKPVVSAVVSGQTVTQTVTVDLSLLNLGFGVGVIPATDTIYVRAHAGFTGGSVPDDNAPYSFNTSVTSTIGGVGVTSASSSQLVTKSSTCVDGGLQ